MLILTHENSDFDAVASQLAAHRLYPQGIPLLSWRINRNVNQFLNLFWEALPFMRPDDWQRQRVDRVVLVDTVSLPSVRGIRPDRVQVQVIDHHELSTGVNPDWTYRVETVGATTTLLVEMLQAAGLTLSINEATLLLLGIHEDTGSLVYDTATARDAHAAAWLLSQGAQLSVVRRFLNIALSDQQQELYDQLVDSVEWIKVEGQSIALAAIEAPGFEDEISAVAHRLRDALTPDGLFLLVQLKFNHVQLVARSSTDYIDVSVVAKALGGGGHSRAAAATIMDRELQDVRMELMDSLPSAIRPMAKVSQIMSYGVHTLPADATILEAAEQMQRFGHEGYPIVDPDDNSLVGLLTRRMVDRAINHQLGDTPVGQIMRAGQVTVQPSDSVEYVQRLMIQDGWGQIPVIAEDDNGGDKRHLIGIVTRTDLINLLTDEAQSEDEPDMRALMANALPQALWDMVKVVGQEASDMGVPLYFVGGLVRDLLLGKPASDIDMVVEGDAISLVRRLRRRFGGETRSHAQFGTAKWLVAPEVWHNVAPGASLAHLPEMIDFVTARTEFYTEPTALPEVERGSIKLDLHRRDFTINTLAVRLDGAHLGELLDFYGGRRDLRLGLIRVLHSLSFVDDPTRILRAVRLEQRLGFRIEERTAELIQAALPMLNRVTGDRIRNELEMCLLEPQPAPILARLDELGVLAQLHPALCWHPETAHKFTLAREVLDDPVWAKAIGDQTPVFVFFALWLLPFPAEVQYETMARLKVRRSTIDDVVACRVLLRELGQLEDDARPSQVFRILRPYPARVLVTALVAAGPDSVNGRRIDDYQRRSADLRPALNGNDLLEMGLEPGPQIGDLLDKLLAARLDGEVQDEAGERALLSRLLASEVEPESDR